MRADAPGCRPACCAERGQAAECYESMKQYEEDCAEILEQLTAIR